MNVGSLLRPSTVGVDIGSSAVKAVSLRRGRGGWSLVAAAEAPLPRLVDDAHAAAPQLPQHLVTRRRGDREVGRHRRRAGGEARRGLGGDRGG